MDFQLINNPRQDPADTVTQERSLHVGETGSQKPSVLKDREAQEDQSQSPKHAATDEVAVTPNSTTLPEHKPQPSRILYHLVQKNDEGTILKNIESSEPISTGDTGTAKTLTDKTVLESLTTNQYSHHSRFFGRPFTTRIKRYSLPLINVLRDIIQYWPGLNLLDHPVVIQEPYEVLVHHMEALKVYKSNHPTCHPPEYVDLCNEHIDILLGYLDRTVGDDIRFERSLHEKSPPMATFANLWMLFRPGQDVYIKKKESTAPIPMRVGITTRGLVDMGIFPANQSKKEFTFDSNRSTLTMAYLVNGWGVGCKGTEMTTQFRSGRIKSFEGEKEISSLDVYPKEFHDNPNYEYELQRRGQKYWSFCTPAYKHYEGATIADRGEPRRKFNGRIVVDFNSYIKYKYTKETGYESDDSDTGYEEEFGFKSINPTWRELPSPRGCECEFCIVYSAKPRESPVFVTVDASNAKSYSDPQIHFLSDYILRGYALKEQKWLSFHINLISDLRIEDSPFKNLILPEEIKTTVQSIVWSYRQPSDEVKAWSADFIQEKGEGQIFLLHGTPGVGKTCTAEIVADYIKRPLLPLTCGDMGITASDVQVNINKYFELGERWGAVILMDEADIYLEQRAPDQLERNSLVSVFLRALEYFRGILFITINRVGTFDDAFISRIHVSLYYPPLIDHDRVLIWENNFRRLEKDTAIRIPESTRIYTRYDEGLKLIKWNGREIRNAIQTAVALAKREANDKSMDSVVLEAHNIEAVVKMSRTFKAYIDQVHGNLDEAGRAKQNVARVDDFKLNGGKGEH